MGSGSPRKAWLAALGLAICAGGLIALAWSLFPRETDPSVRLRLRGLDLDEISGMALSRVHEGHLWVHEDDRGDARVHRFDERGRHRQTIRLLGVDAQDFEDMAVGPLPDGSPHGLLIGDLGADRDPAVRPAILVVDERDTLAGDEVTLVHRVAIAWPGRVPDVEALLVEPATGDILLWERGGEGGLHRITFPEWSAATDPVTPVLVDAAEIEGEVTGGDCHPESGLWAVRTRRRVFVFQGLPSASNLVAEFPTPNEPQGEAVTFAADGRSVLTASERSLLIRQRPLPAE